MTQVAPIIQEDAGHIVAEHEDVFSELAGANVLITGASGFLCSYFVDVFATYNNLAAGERIAVTALDNHAASLPTRLAHLAAAPGVTFREHDVIQPLRSDERFDYIIHGASIASPVYYRQHPFETIDVNVNGTWRMLEMAEDHGSRAFLFLSSSEVYGDPAPDMIPTREDYWGNVSCLGPRACYDESKRLGETLCHNFHAARRLAAKIVRPFNVYGPGQRLNDQRIIPDLMASSLEGGPLVLYSDGRPTRSFCYARDFVRGALLVLLNGAPGQAYNVGNDQEISIGELAELMARVAGEPDRPLQVERRISGDADYLVDNPNRRCPDLTRLRTELSWTPRVDLEEGLRRTLRSYRDAMADRAISSQVGLG